MLFKVNRLFRHLRRRKSVGVGLLLAILVSAFVGNALTFFFFDRGSKPDLALVDAFWYSVISITTIGYGDFAASSAGARIGTAVFVVVVGLSAFTTIIGVGVDWILDLREKERTGMSSPGAKNHLLIINFPNERRVLQIIEEYLQDPRHQSDEIVLMTDQIESMPFAHPSVSFVRGSPLEEETYRRANVAEARQAIVLSTDYDDPHSDSVAASIASMLEHLNPDISCVAECLNARHSLLFEGVKNVTLVYTFRISNNMIVQEAQDPGVTRVTQAITSNTVEGTLLSTIVGGDVEQGMRYIDVAKRLLDHGLNLVGVVRGEHAHVSLDELALAENDRLVYVSRTAHDWEAIRSFLA